MKIGIDFDNTIVSYDRIFHTVARERGLIPADLPQTKLSVRDHLRETGREDIWTEMQGYVYGARMDEATMYPGVREFLGWARDRKLSLCIISHKTRRPYLGADYDLHAAAARWVERFLKDARGMFVAPDQVYFEVTKEEKLGRIGSAGCDWFIDDLPEILLAAQFPERAGRILFDPDRNHAPADGLTLMPSWAAIRAFFEKL